jgi:hypothetical protein
MSLFCLVHGSTQGPSGWDLLTRELSALGHATICADLPVDRPDLPAAAYAGRIDEALRGHPPAVVVAHSASGLFMPLVSAPVVRLVYLAAVLPSPGESFLAQYQRWPEMYHPAFVGKNPTASASLAREFLFHDCAEDVAAWAVGTLRLMNARQALTEPCPLTAFPTIPSTYVSCQLDRTIQAAWWDNAARERLGVQPVMMETGHSPHVSRPVELAAILSKLTTEP